MSTDTPFLTRMLITTGLVRKRPVATPMKSVREAAQAGEPDPAAARQAAHQRLANPTAEPGTAVGPAIATKVKMPKVDGAEAVHTLIPPTARIVGAVEISENVVFQGSVIGDVTVNGDHQVILAKTAGMHGTLRSKVVVISCELQGNIEAERVILMETAVVRGDITYGTLAMAEGAVVEGRLQRAMPNVIEEHTHGGKELGIDLGPHARVEPQGACSTDDASNVMDMRTRAENAQLRSA